MTEHLLQILDTLIQRVFLQMVIVLTATVEGTITNVGETANEVKSYVVERGDKDVTKNYTSVKVFLVHWRSPREM